MFVRVAPLFFKNVTFPVRLSSQATPVEAEGFKPRIGLEIHAQLGSSAKLFSDAAAPSCSTLPSNGLVSAFDLALPGTLPTLNRKCVEQCLLVAVLLNCEIAKVCRFDRKHYFYPDLPLGYQITQKTCPIARNGFFDFFSQSDKASTSFYEKRVRIEQLQLEMDSGKTLRAAEHDLIDLNRAGVGLVEIVTAPDLTNAFEATLFVEQLRHLLGHNGVCSGQFHEGQFRVDVNVSVTVGSLPGKRTELKNLSSINLLHAAIENELRRQTALLRTGEKVEEETRAVDSKGRTASARTKGVDMDYRFIPEPNLPPLKVDPVWVDSAKECARREMFFHRCVVEFGFPPSFAIEVMNDSKMDSFIRQYVSHDKMIPYERLSPWLQELKFACDKLSIGFPPTDPIFVRHFAELIALNEQKRLTKLICIELLRELGSTQSRQPLVELVDQRQLWQITDPEQIRQIVQCVLEEQPEAAERARARPEGRQFVKLRRAVLDSSHKRIDPVDVDRLMSELLEEGQN
uniref:Glutamyl-tRNA(Gln) amidotransferase subunit B, mitochondrial n=1 Tax=Globodera rostochiensis TaxID=31243 RepID=A0A914HCL3_GLORO